MTSAHPNSGREDRNQDELHRASTVSSRGDRGDVEQRFARLTALEVNAKEMELTGLLGDTDRTPFVERINEMRDEMADESAALQIRADEVLRDHEFIRNKLPEKLRSRSKELEQEFRMQQEAQRLGTREPSLFGAMTPEKALWDDCAFFDDVEESARESREYLQNEYEILQLIKKHTHTPWPDVLHQLDLHLKEKLISMEEIHPGFEQPMAQLISMWRTLKDSNGTMYQAPEDSTASSSKS